LTRNPDGKIVTGMRSKFLIRLLAFAFGFLAAHGAEAATLVGDTKLPFSADRVVVTNGKTYQGRVFAVPGKQRHEQEINGLRVVVILRADRQVAWLVMPDLHVYTEFAFPKAVGDYGSASTLGPPVGNATLAGLKASEYRVEREGSDGSALDAWVWMTGDGIVVKLDGTFTSTNAMPVNATLELSNVKTGPQNAALFELPPGANKLPPEALQPLLNMRMPKR
jgi:hypothetical protein